VIKFPQINLSQITLLYLIAYYYHSVNVISFYLSQSDHIKQLPLYNYFSYLTFCSSPILSILQNQPNQPNKPNKQSQQNKQNMQKKQNKLNKRKIFFPLHACAAPNPDISGKGEFHSKNHRQDIPCRKNGRRCPKYFLCNFWHLKMTPLLFLFILLFQCYIIFGTFFTL
jgi:hypothetical protein